VESPPHDVYNLGSGEMVGPENFAAAVNAAVPGAAVFPTDAGAAEVPLVDLARIRDELGYEPQWPLTRAIPHLVSQLRAEGA
jgi:nucleoside-diphosphate-sugar epimerase